MTQPHKKKIAPTADQYGFIVQTRKSPTLKNGFSIVELLVAMTLGLFVIGGAITMFSGNKRSNDLSEALSGMQEDVRFAIETISTDVRLAGYQGCASFTGGSLSVRAVDAPMTNPDRGLLDTAIWGSEIVSATNWEPMPPYGTGSSGFTIPDEIDAVAGTHALALQFGQPNAARLRVSPTNEQAAIPILGDADSQLEAGDLMIISDCLGGEIFEALSNTHVDGAGNLNIFHSDDSINTTDSFEIIYGEGTTLEQVRVLRFRSDVYFVGDTGLTNSSGDMISALYQQSFPYNDNQNPPIELIQGVEDLRLSFGISTGGQTVQYVDPGDASFRADAVRSVKIGLLMSSFDRLAESDDTNTYLLAGQTISPAGTAGATATHPGDRRARFAFNTTVKIRNTRENDNL